MTDSTRITDILARASALKTARSTFESTWQSLAEVMRTERADFTAERTPGERRNENVFDGTSQQAARGLATALDGMLKGRDSPFFNMRAEEDALNEVQEAKDWLDDSDKRMWKAIFDDRAHFAGRSFEVDQDLVTFGTGVLFTGETVGGGLLFRSLHLRDTLIAENNRGDIDTVFETFSYTARQAVQQWGLDKLGDKTREAITQNNGKAKPDQRFKFMHVVTPREDADPGDITNKGFPFASLWIDVESEHLIEESGYEEFPYAVPRWETLTGEVYGRSPGMYALADSNTLQAMSRTNLDAGEKIANPPLLAASDGLTSAVRLFPGGINYVDYDAVPAGRRPLEPLITGANLPIALEMENQRRDMIWAAFFRNILQLPVDSPQMTATEILERKKEFLRVVGPTFGRLESGYIAPIVNRVFAIMMRRTMLGRAGGFAPIPKVLQGRDIKFVFDSPISQARKQVEALAVREALEQAAPFLEISPQSMDFIDGDKAVKTIFEASKATAIIRPDDQVQAKRQADAEAAQAEQLAADAERALGAAGQVAQIAQTQPAQAA